MLYHIVYWNEERIVCDEVVDFEDMRDIINAIEKEDMILMEMVDKED